MSNGPPKQQLNMCLDPIIDIEGEEVGTQLLASPLLRTHYASTSPHRPLGVFEEDLYYGFFQHTKREKC